MKATLEFDLPEDSYDHNTAINAGKYRSALYEIDEMCRRLLKYGQDVSTDAEELAEGIRSEIWETGIHE